MGKVYKRKRRSCAMCKPHKMGWSHKRTNKETALCKAHEDAMDELVVLEDRLLEWDEAR